MKVMTGIKFCDTAANKGDVSDKPAKNNCWFPKILHHHHTIAQRCKEYNLLK